MAFAATPHERGRRDDEMIGMTRSAVAESDREALEVARRVHRRRHQSFILLWEKHGT
jgi:hypothetical protein